MAGGTNHDREDNNIADAAAAEGRSVIAEVAAGGGVFEQSQRTVSVSMDSRSQLPDDSKLDAMIATVMWEVDLDAKIEAAMRDDGVDNLIKVERLELKAYQVLQEALGESYINSNAITDQDLRKLVEGLKSNLLALKLAGSFIKQNPRPVDAYLQLYEEKKRRLSQVLQKVVDSLDVVFEITRDHLVRTNMLAATAPQNLSVFASAPHIIPNAVLLEICREEVLPVLSSYALIERCEAGVLMEGALQEAIRKGITWVIMLNSTSNIFGLRIVELSCLLSQPSNSEQALPHFKSFHAQLKTIGFDKNDPQGYKNFLKNYMSLAKRVRDESQLSVSAELAELYKIEGNVLFQRRDYEKSLKQYKKAVQYRPKYKEAYLNQAMCLHKLGRNTEALQALEQALQIDPSYDKACYQKASILITLGRFSEASLLINQSHPAESQPSWRSLQQRLPAEQASGAAAGAASVPDPVEAWQLGSTPRGPVAKGIEPQM